MRVWSRLLLVGVTAASICLASAATGTAVPTVVSLEERNPYAPTVKWSFYKKPIPSGAAKKIILRKHLLRVVEVRTSADSTQLAVAEKRAEVAKAARLLQDQLPGLRIRIRWERPVDASPRACQDPSTAFTAVHKRVPEGSYLKTGQHLAALVNCGAGLGFASGGGDPGSGAIWAPWRSNVIAHELGHTLGLWGHSGSMDCAGKPIHPRSCTIVEYGDPTDLMGNRGMEVVSGFWRDFALGAQKVPLDRASEWQIQAPGQGRLAKPLKVQSSLGTLYLDLTPAGGMFFREPAVLVRLLVKVEDMYGVDIQQVILDLPLLSGSADADPIPGFYAGDRFALPGTDLIVEVGAVTDVGAEIRVTRNGP